MTNCAICGNPVLRSQAAIEHIKPLSQGGENIETNTRTVHIHCHRNRRLSLKQRILRRIGYWRWKLIMWADRQGK